MKATLFLAAAGTLGLLAPLELTAEHQAGETRTITFEHESSGEMVDMLVTMNGEEGPMGPEMTQERTHSISGTFVDQVRAADGGRATAFTREYTDLAEFQSFLMESDMMGSMEDSQDRVSGLDGLIVSFERGDEGFEASWPEGESGDDELLDGLGAELPFARFLPGDEVEVGDEWEIAPEALFELLELGSDLSFEGEDPSSEGMLSMEPEEVEGDMDGEVTATLKSIDDDGNAVIELAYEVTVLRDLTEQMQAQMGADAPEDAPEGMMMPDIVGMEVEESVEGEGRLLWSTRGKHAIELSLEYESEQVETMTMEMSMGADTMEIMQESTHNGEGTLTLGVEVSRE